MRVGERRMMAEAGEEEPVWDRARPPQRASPWPPERLLLLLV